ncbi:MULTISPECIES: hypothetical protein [Meiothermus]|uniref:Uncharacterized protein n=1 Tax=Meiothermus taiwanensis WR-220 TaxID=1339250 RepID=A0ABN5M127_9DEIN|nr:MULTISPECIES: hypothetical protein [Meiothermus]AWR88195.1 hypothetical protein Mtai_v1c29770 [Meiothermus taiwanensis WR-220]GIW29800.1 MAG: hypothetical protein KatS3mg070_3163 [Meiothermus sp.]
MPSPKRLREFSYEELMALMGEAIKTPQAADELLKAMEEEPGLLDRFEGVQWLDLSQVYGDLIHRRDQRC